MLYQLPFQPQPIWMALNSILMKKVKRFFLFTLSTTGMLKTPFKGDHLSFAYVYFMLKISKTGFET